MRNRRLCWILLHKALRIVGKDGNEEGKICALTDMFSSTIFGCHTIQEPQRSNNLAKIYYREAIHP